MSTHQYGGREDGTGLNPTNVTKDSHIIGRNFFLIASATAKSVVPLKIEEVRPSRTSEHLITKLFRTPKRAHHLIKYLCGSLENYSIFLSARLTTNTKMKIIVTSTSVRVKKSTLKCTYTQSGSSRLIAVTALHDMSHQ